MVSKKAAKTLWPQLTQFFVSHEVAAAKPAAPATATTAQKPAAKKVKPPAVRESRAR